MDIEIISTPFKEDPLFSDSDMLSTVSEIASMIELRLENEVITHVPRMLFLAMREDGELLLHAATLENAPADPAEQIAEMWGWGVGVAQQGKAVIGGFLVETQKFILNDCFFGSSALVEGLATVMVRGCNFSGRWHGLQLPLTTDEDTGGLSVLQRVPFDDRTGEDESPHLSAFFAGYIEGLEALLDGDGSATADRDFGVEGEESSSVPGAGGG